MASPPRPFKAYGGQTYRIPKRPFSNAYTVQQRRSTVREGYTKQRHRAHVRAKGEDDGYADDRQVNYPLVLVVGRHVFERELPQVRSVG